MEKRCPHCEEVIDYVRYRTPMIEYGTAGIHDGDFGDYESDDNESTGSSEFSCPECDNSLEYDDLLDIDDDDDDDDENDGRSASEKKQIETRVQ